MGSTSSATASSTEQSTSSSTTGQSAGTAPTDAQKAEAEKLKAQGNAKMSSKDYDAAIELYTEAIAKDGTNAVYYSNRAAAYSSKGDHANAVKDGEMALEIDPAFVRAYHRLG